MINEIFCKDKKNRPFQNALFTKRDKRIILKWPIVQSNPIIDVDLSTNH